MHPHSASRYVRRGFARRQPDPLPPGIVFSSDSRSAEEPRLRGGDLFDAYLRPDGSSMVLLADVSSKGPLGVVHAEMLRRAFRNHAIVERSPSRVMTLLNGLRFNGPQPAFNVIFATALIVEIDRSAPLCRYASAGHDIGLLIEGRAHRHLTSTGPLLGVFSEPAYTDCMEPFGPDAMLLLASDGFTECRHETEPERQFGTTGIIRALMSDVLPSCHTAARAVTARADAFTGGRYYDDATVAVIARNGGG